MLTKQQRAEEANLVLAVLATHGRKFFWDRHSGRMASFSVDDRGRVWFIDDYNNKRIYTHYSGRWRWFSQGGTMRRLVEALRDYIRTGKKISPGHFGPWPKEFCDGDLWGYGFDEMQKVRAKVLATEAVRTELPTQNPEE